MMIYVKYLSTYALGLVRSQCIRRSVNHILQHSLLIGDGKELAIKENGRMHKKKMCAGEGSEDVQVR